MGVLQLGLLLSTFASSPAASAASGPLVESVDPGSPAETAGVRAGDEVIAWSQGPDGGEIRSPSDLEDAENERGPRGPALVTLRRGPDVVTVTVDAESWGFRVRPVVTTALEAEVTRSREAHAAGRKEEAAQWLARLATVERDPGVRAWLHSESGVLYRSASQFDNARAEYEAALVDATGPGVRALAVSRANAIRDAGHSEEARQAWEALVQDLEASDRESLTLAYCLRELGRLFTTALDLESAERVLVRSVAIGESRAPDSPLLAMLWSRLANLYWFRGELSDAQRYYELALAIQERKLPGSERYAETLMDTGVIAVQRGDLATGEARLRRSAMLLENTKRGAATPLRLTCLLNLAEVFEARGDLDAAEDVVRTALDVGKNLPPQSGGLELALSALADVARLRGDLAEADRQATLALEAAPNNTYLMVPPLLSIGEIALVRGDIGRAEAHFARIEGVFSGTAADRSPHVLRTLLLHGDALRARGDRRGAESYYNRVLRTVRDVGGSFIEAESLGRLASVALEAGEPARAAEVCDATLSILEKQRGRMGGSRERNPGMSAFAGIYAECAEAFLQAGRVDAAFGAVEASRARALLELLAERDLRFTHEIPPELEKERRRVKGRYEQVQASLDAAGEGQVAALQAELRSLEAARLRISEEVRRSSLRLGGIEDPRPLSLDEARRSLDTGTLLLSYVVGRDRTILFAVSHDRPTATFVIPEGREALGERTRAFSSLLRDRGASPGSLVAMARELYGLLVGPAQSMVRAHARLLVSPDGPLLVVPFAALVEPSHLSSQPRFLVEGRPIHTVTSATLFAELRRARRAPGALVAAFGDAVYPSAPEAIREVALRSGVRGRPLTRLPGTGDEVREIARLFPKESRSFLGNEATEEHAKSLPASVRYVHFGCHALLNARSPLDSALVLSLPDKPVEGRDNGILQAWEIFEDVRLNADLVTLSACESGRGTEVAGEGLVGLTRAFQYAGARSVLASFWNVEDDSTARLMARFYRGLKAGKTKDRALQDAQIALIRQGYAPFHWAAFQLTGDWK